MKFTIDMLKNFLGSAAATVISEEPFKNWKFEKSFENQLKNPRIDYAFPESGFDFICDRNEKVRTIFLYSDGHRCFAGDLVDLPFSSTRQEVLNRLGVPSKSGGLIDDPILGKFGPWDRFGRSGYSIHVEYKANADSISKITLMRADVVP